MADTSIGKAYVQIVPTAKGISNDIEGLIGGDVEKSGKSAGDSFASKMVGTIKKVAIAAGIGKMFADAISEGANLEQSFGGLDTIYGDAADAAKQYAYEAAKAGISANDYAEQAVSFGASLKQAFQGDTAKAVEAANTAIMDMTDNAAKMGTPIENIQNAYQGFAKQNYTMLDNLKLGYGGTKEEMQRLLSDAQELSGVEYNIDNLGDVYDAIHVIQEDLGLTGVAADEAATTFSGSLGAMKAAASNLLANLATGKDIGPQLAALGTSIQNFLVGNAIPMIGNIVKQIPKIFAELPGFISQMLPQVVPAIADMVSGLAVALYENAPAFTAAVGDMLMSAWDAITNIDWDSAGQLIADMIAQGWELLKTAAAGIWDFVVGIFTGKVDFPDLSGAAKAVWNALVTVASDIWTAVKTWFTKTFTWPNISNAARFVWGKLVTVASSIWESVKGWFTKTFSFPSLTAAAKTAWNGLKTAAQTIWNAIKAIFGKVFSFPSLSGVARAAWHGLTTVASTIWSAVKSLLTKVFSFPSLDGVASKAWDTLKGIASGVWDGIKGVFGALDISFADLSELASKAWDGLKDIAGGVWDGIKEIFGSFDIEWPDFGELAKGALEGLKNAAKGVWDWVKGLFGGKNDDEAVKTVEGTTSEMAAALADAQLKISSVDMSAIQIANEHVKNTVLSWKRIFDNLKLKLPSITVSTLAVAKKAVVEAVANMKATMKFTWSLPTLHGRLPVISVTMRQASSSDGKTTVSYPELNASSFKWFKEGGIFHDPTVIGIGDTKGPEAAVPLDLMWKQMGKEFDKHLGTGVEVTNYITVNGAEDPAQYAETLAREIKQRLRMA